MNKEETISLTLLIKLGSIAIHAEELISPTGHIFDKGALRGLLQDKEIRELLNNPNFKVFFPEKR